MNTVTSHITIAPAEGTWVVRSDDAILAETERALELREGGHAPVLYVPREDVAMALFERTATQTTCPWKGEASYYAYAGRGGTVPDVAWSYESPKDDVAAIGNHLAFYPSKVTIERI